MEVKQMLDEKAGWQKKVCRTYNGKAHDVGRQGVGRRTKVRRMSTDRSSTDVDGRPTEVCGRKSDLRRT